MPGVFYTGNRYLTLAETDHNASLVCQYFWDKGWTAQAICAMLGNMRDESQVNPGVWQDFTVGTGGYGLVQWDPYTNYSNWYGPGWEDNGYGECDRIEYEKENNLQWGNNVIFGPPPYTFADFSVSQEPLDDLVWNFMVYYERNADPFGRYSIRCTYADRFLHMFFTTPFPAWLLAKIQNDNLRRWLKI